MSALAKAPSDTVVIEGRALYRALVPLGFVARNAPKSLPLASMVRLTAGADGLRLTAADLDTEASTRLDLITGDAEYEVCADARVLAAVARIAGPAPVALRLDGCGEDGGELVATVDGGAAEYRLAATSAESFPVFAWPRGAEIERFTNGQLVDALNRCRRAVSHEETRYYLNGACWDQSRPDGRHFVATDGHRLLRHTYSTEPGDGSQRIIPKHVVALLCRHFSGEDAVVFASGTPQCPGLEIAIGACRLVFKTIDGTYPDYGRVVPKPDDARHRIDVGVPELAQALRSLEAMPRSRSDHFGRCVRFHPRDGRMALDVRCGELGTAVARTGAEWPKGAPEFGLNGDYLASLIERCSGRLGLWLSDANAPVLVLDDDASMTRVIMPMRVWR